MRIGRFKNTPCRCKKGVVGGGNSLVALKSDRENKAHRAKDPIGSAGDEQQGPQAQNGPEPGHLGNRLSSSPSPRRQQIQLFCAPRVAEQEASRAAFHQELHAASCAQAESVDEAEQF